MAGSVSERGLRVLLLRSSGLHPATSGEDFLDDVPPQPLESLLLMLFPAVEPLLQAGKPGQSSPPLHRTGQGATETVGVLLHRDEPQPNSPPPVLRPEEFGEGPCVVGGRTCGRAARCS